MAIDYGLSGPNLRGSGVDWDLRKAMPYSVYSEFDFDVPVGRGMFGTVGDCYDRYICRTREMGESSKIVRQALDKILTTPEGDIVAPKVSRNLKVEAGEALSRVESARGEMAFYVVADGTTKAWRVRTRTGSFTAMGIIEAVSPGLMVADLVALIASLDVVAPEIDR
jgi:NADH-quinone oxidoreductase subunit D